MSGQLPLIPDLPTSFAMMSRRSIFFFSSSSHNTDESTYSSYSRYMSPISSSPLLSETGHHWLVGVLLQVHRRGRKIDWSSSQRLKGRQSQTEVHQGLGSVKTPWRGVSWSELGSADRGSCCRSNLSSSRRLWPALLPAKSSTVYAGSVGDAVSAGAATLFTSLSWMLASNDRVFSASKGGELEKVLMRLNNQSYHKDLCQNPLNRFGFEELYQWLLSSKINCWRWHLLMSRFSLSR